MQSCFSSLPFHIFFANFELNYRFCERGANLENLKSKLFKVLSCQVQGHAKKMNVNCENGEVSTKSSQWAAWQRSWKIGGDFIFFWGTLATKYIFTKLYFTKVFQQTELPNSPPTFKTCGFRSGVSAKGRRTFLLKLKYSIFAKHCLLTDQEQACTKITWLFVCLFVTMPKMAQYTGKWSLSAL